MSDINELDNTNKQETIEEAKARVQANLKRIKESTENLKKWRKAVFADLKISSPETLEKMKKKNPELFK